MDPSVAAMDPAVGHLEKPTIGGGHPPGRSPYPETGPAAAPSRSPPPHPAPEVASQPRSPPSDHPPSDHPPMSENAVYGRSDPTRGAHPGGATSIPAESNPYITPSPAEPPSSKNTMETVKNVLSRWGKKAGEATKKAEVLSRNTWQHLKTGPSFADAAMGRIAQGTKVIAEGGYDKIFRQTFETIPEEQLRKSYACYLSTSAGPVMGILYLSTARLAFCSDNPLSYKVGDQSEWSYYKVVIPLHQLRAVNPSISRANPAEKHIQVVSIDNHEFWFMAFVNYDSAVKNLQEALAGVHNPVP